MKRMVWLPVRIGMISVIQIILPLFYNPVPPILIKSKLLNKLIVSSKYMTAKIP